MTMSRLKRLFQSEADTQATVKQLESAFTEFHQTHEPGRRIPKELRSRVLRAVDEGVPVRQIRKTCRVSWKQLKQWRSGAAARRASSVPQPPQVLAVVDDRVRKTTTSDGIEIGIGPWRVSVTHAA